MVIKRIYNNSVVLVSDLIGREQIVLGKGIAYQKKIGDWIDKSSIEKVFMLKDQHEMTKLEEILEDIPEIYLTIADEIIRMIKEYSDLTLSDRIYVTLIDHISISLEREQKGVIFQNPLLMEIKQFYKKEYALALKAADIIEQYLHMKISDDEAGFITLHIVNASMNQNIMDTMKVTQMIQDVLSIVEQFFYLKLDRESLYYNRFIRHLQFFAKKIAEKTIENAEDDFMYRMGKIKYPESYRCVRQIEKKLQTQYGIIVTKFETGYLIYHIENLIRHMESKKS